MNMTTRLVIRKTSELRPYEKNARVHPKAQIDKLRASLRQYGFVRPLLVNAEGMVLAGHGILEAAVAEGIEEAPCVPVEHLSAEEARAYILADNRLAELSVWDEEIVSSELMDLRGSGLDLSLTGFSASDILITPTDEVREDECDLTPPEAPVAQPGQLWQLGRHRLLCGDATSPPPGTPVRRRRTAGGPAADGSSVWRGLYELRRVDHQRREKRRGAFRVPAAGLLCGG